jgi:hypothetical protein
MILEKRDKVGDGSFEVIGYQNALRGDIAGVTRDESANGGDWIVPLTTVEKWAEVTLVGSAETYESAKKEFEGLFGFEPVITRMVLTDDSSGQIQLSADGLVIVEYVWRGEKVRNTYSALDGTYIDVPSLVNVTIYGNVTAINEDEGQNIFSSLDVSKNTALTTLNCSGCTGLMLLDIQNTASLVNGTFVDSTMTELTTIQLNGTSLRAQINIGTWLEEYAPNDGKLYVDQNTSQDVIVAAESKDWEVIYVS